MSRSRDKASKMAIKRGSSLLFVAMVIALLFSEVNYAQAGGLDKGPALLGGGGGEGSQGSSDGGGLAGALSNAHGKLIETICQHATYKETCINSLTKAAGKIANPTEIIKIGFKLAKDEISASLARSETIKAAQNDPRSAQGLEICHEVVEYAVGDLEKSVNSMGSLSSLDMGDFLEDVRVWLGGAITYQDVCFDAFENATDTEPGLKMRQYFGISRELTSNALAMVDQIKDVGGFFNIGGHFGINTGNQRRLLGKKKKEESVDLTAEHPPWLKDPQRKIIDQPLETLKPDVVVALDGSGKFKQITEALALVPKDNVKPFIIYIKAGVYKELVSVEKKVNNVVFVGDGPTKTIITGDRSFKGGFQTFKTATVAIMGDGFIARDIGIENTAGAEGHQAVALRVAGDFAVFFNCKFDGYQDTLYPVRSRQFYRQCTISGTIDFIFGDAQVVFQNCEMVIRKPMESQSCMVTAQGRSDPNGPGVTVLQNCKIVGAPEYLPVKEQNKAYLGRPWKEYSRTIVMQSDISDVIAPEGWMPWQGNFALDTLFYAEFENRGPGANTAGRVPWKGIKKLEGKDIEPFTPENLFKGSEWVVPTGAPYEPGMVKV